MTATVSMLSWVRSRTGILENQDDGKLFKYWTTRYFDDADYKFDD